MVEEARVRNPSPRARFEVSDGVHVPVPLRDRSYDLVIALAVFIHCPIEVIEKLLTGVATLLSPSGEIRFQLRGDYKDSIGIQASPAAEACVEVACKIESEGGEYKKLMEGTNYAGHAFTYLEAERLLDAVVSRKRFETALFRYDPLFIYGIIRSR
jgi:hypothetical protein